MTDKKSLAVKAVRGAGWTIVTGLGSRLLGLVGTLVLTYFLARDVIGEVSAASVVTLLGSQLSTIGVGQYLIAKPGAGREVAWHATVLHLSLGFVAMALCIALQAPLSVFFHTPRLHLFLPGLVLSVLLDRFGFIPERLLARDMRFRVIGLTRTAGELSYTTASVGLAIAGFGGMAIVYANILRSALRMTCFIASTKRADWLTPSRYSRETMRAMLGFGVPFSIGSSAEFAARRVDNLLITHLFGPGVMGSYNYAYNFADVPATQIGEQIGDVLLPTFAHMDHEQRKSALVRSTGLLALLVFPLAVGLGAVSQSLVHAIFKPEWFDVAPMLTVLSALSITRPIGWTISAYLQARDKPRAVLVLEVFKLLCLVVCIMSVGRLGPLWACFAVGLAFAGHAFGSLWTVYRYDSIPLLHTLGRCLPPLFACVPMALAVIGVRHVLEGFGIDPMQKFRFLWIWSIRKAWWFVGAELLTGAIVYVLAALVIARSMSKDFLNLVRNALRKRSGKRLEAGAPEMVAE